MKNCNLIYCISYSTRKTLTYWHYCSGGYSRKPVRRGRGHRGSSALKRPRGQGDLLLSGNTSEEATKKTETGFSQMCTRTGKRQPAEVRPREILTRDQEKLFTMRVVKYWQRIPGRLWLSHLQMTRSVCPLLESNRT